MADQRADSETTAFLLPERLIPRPERTGLDEPFWSALRVGRLLVQRCGSCGDWQWGPEWLCRYCLSFDIGWEEVPPDDGEYRGVVYSWERVWHPTDSLLVDAVPYLAVVVTLPTAGNVRMVGNVIGDQHADIAIGSPVRAVFEHHDDHTLVQWERCSRQAEL